VVIISLARCGASRTGCSLRVRAAFVAPKAELLIHDLDDNLVWDGRWMYYSDAKNWLMRVMNLSRNA